VASISDSEDLIDAWVNGEPDAHRRQALLLGLMNACDNFDDLMAQAPIPGRSPLTRRIAIPEAGLLVDVFLGLPVRCMKVKLIHDSM